MVPNGHCKIRSISKKPHVQVWFWDHLTRFVPLCGGPKPAWILPTSNGLLSPVRCPIIPRIIAAMVRDNVEPQTLENRRNWLFFCVHSRVGQAWSHPCPKTGWNAGKRVRMTLVRNDLQSDAWDQGDLQARDFPWVSFQGIPTFGLCELIISTFPLNSSPLPERDAAAAWGLCWVSAHSRDVGCQDWIQRGDLSGPIDVAFLYWPTFPHLFAVF